MQRTKIRATYVVCLWEVTGWGFVDLIEVKRDCQGLLFSPVNEKLLVSCQGDKLQE